MKILNYIDKVARHPKRKYPKRTITEILEIGIHHSLTKEGSAEAYARYHVGTLGWPGPGYTFVIEKDGTIKQINEITWLTYHVGNSNRWALGICLTGDFRTQKPTNEQLDSLEWLLNYLTNGPLRHGGFKGIRGHSEFPGYSWKACPVFDYKEVVRRLEKVNGFDGTLRPGMKGPAVTSLQEALINVGEQLPRFGADGDYGRETTEAVKAFQSRHGLIVDGIAGARTMEKLIGVTSPKQEPQKDWIKEQQEAREWVIEKGISDGSRPDDPVSRKEFWVSLKRYDEGKRS
jgi:N-acetylmuramoyl-L-alanine amidase